MNILFINNAFPTQLIPQRATYAREILNCLEQAGNRVDKIVMNIDGKNSFDKNFNYLRFYLDLLKANYNKYDAIYINHYPFCFLPIVFHIKNIPKLFVHWHGMDLIPQSFFKKLFYSFAYATIPKKAVHIVPSEYLKRVLQGNLKVPDEKIHISPSGGIDTQVFTDIRNQLKVSNKINLGYASALNKNKGADLIIKLVNDLPSLEADTGKELTLHCIGYGKDKQYYLSKLNGHRKLVVHKPFTKTDIPKFYQEIDILLFPTLNESLGLVGLEAMSCNVPVAGTDDFALKEYILPDLTGEKFIKNDYRSFRQALQKIIKNIYNYHPRSLVLEKYSRESVIDGYKALFNAH